VSRQLAATESEPLPLAIACGAYALGNRGDERVHAIGAPDGSEAQVAAQRAAAGACGAGRVMRPVSHQEVHDVARGESVNRNRSATEPISQELPYPPPAVRAGLGRQSADLLQIAGEAFQFVVNRGRHPDAACHDPIFCA